MRDVARSAALAALCGVMAGQPVAAMAAVSRVPAATVSENQVQGRDRVVHALDRLTFGPRPGEVEAVEREGLQRWFARQLNPGSIDDSALEAREDQYPAMRMSLEELMVRFPSPQMLKQIENGKRPMPTDAVQAAMVRDELAFYEMAQAKKAEKKGDSGVAPTHRDETAMNGAQGGGNGMNRAPEVLEMRGQAALDAADDGAMAGAQRPLTASEVSAADDVAYGQAGGMDGKAPHPSTMKQSKDGAPGSERAEAERVLALGPAERMRAILGMQPMEVVRFRQSLKPAEAQAMLTGLTPAQRETLVALPGGVRMVALEAMESRLERDIYSERELEAVMTDFWLNHFNVYVRKNQQEPYLLPAYERETIRPHALGRFEDLLVATAESPAMLVYLDNFRSIGPESQAAERVKMAQARNPNGPAAKQASAGLNENYGRELMELHTLGVNGWYTQADVTNVAKVFTGWTIAGPNQQQRGLFSRAKVGEFEFDERRHEPGAKTVLGVTIKNNGMKEGLEVLHMLATSPATAHFVSEKLAVRFVSDTPPAALVDRMAASYLQSGGEIKAVLRTMFNSPEFWAKDVYRAKVKTPEEFVVSAVRASGVEVENPQALVQSLDKLGMPLYGMQTPNGYSWTKDAWVGTGQLVSRMNFALVLAGGRMPGVRTEWGTLLGEVQAGVQPAAYDATAGLESKERRLEGVLLDDPVSERTRATVLGQAGDAGVTSQAETQFDLGGGGKKKGDYAARGLGRVGMAGPGDDPQAAVMAGLLLGSPEFQRR